MLKARRLRGHLIELVVVFVGVALAFGVENLREELNERSVGAQYLSGFRQDLVADLEMLRIHQGNLRTRSANAVTVLEFFEGRPIEPQAFFEAYWPALFALRSAPNRNTMNEVLNSGNLRLVRDDGVRAGLLDLYATYDRIAQSEEHIAVTSTHTSTIRPSRVSGSSQRVPGRTRPKTGSRWRRSSTTSPSRTGSDCFWPISSLKGGSWSCSSRRDRRSKISFG